MADIERQQERPARAEEPLARRRSRKPVLSFDRLIYYAQALDAVEHGGLFTACYGGRVFIPYRNPWAEVAYLRDYLRVRGRERMAEKGDK